MRFILPLILIASSAIAQQAADPVANFPVEAITQVTQPDVPGAPDSGKKPDVPPSPKAPEQPVGAVPDLWPANTIPVFVLACTQGNAQLIGACRCTIEALMVSMTHREFMELSQRNAVDKDLRYTSARQQCALKAQQTLKKP